MLYIILALFLVLFVFAGYIFFKVTKLKEIKNSLDICSNKIEDTLNKKHKIINDVLKKINNARLTKEFEYKDSFTLQEKEKCLFDIGFSINKYVNNHKDLDLNNELRELNYIEETLDGLKDFYNAHVLNYNEIFLKKYLNKIYRVFKFSDYKAFKIRKLEEYEIFKVLKN